MDNLFDMFTYVYVENGDDENVKKMFADIGYDDVEDGMSVDLATIYKFDIPDKYVHWDSSEFMKDEFEYYVETLIDKFPHYLVMAHGCRWNGASGYKIVDTIGKAFERGYEVSFSVISNTNKCIKLCESSHDVPTGSITYVIGLTVDEYDDLEESDFDSVVSWADTITASIS
jgi:hypothetical protein